MKKFAAVFAAIILACTCLCACGENETALPAPDKLRVVDKVFVWAPVEHATGYEVSVEGVGGRKTEECRYGLFALQGEEYTLKVRALGNLEYSDSAWAEIKYDPSAAAEEDFSPALSPFSYRLLEDGSGYSVSKGAGEAFGDVVIPDEYKGLPVKQLNSMLFCETSTVQVELLGNVFDMTVPSPNEDMTSLTLPSNLEVILPSALAFCFGLKELVLPDSVQLIYAAAFSTCINLRSIVIPVSLTMVLGDPVTDCPNIECFYYKGTETQWKNIDTASAGELLYWSRTKVYFYSETEQEGCWHMVDGKPVLW